MERDRKQRKLKGWRTAWFACMATAALAFMMTLAPGSAFGQEDVVAFVAPDAAAQAQATLEYWTPERMRKAIPIPMPASAPQQEAVVRASSLPNDARPGFTRGWQPGSGPQPDPTPIELTPDQAVYAAAPRSGELQASASPPFSPSFLPNDYANYAPFQRWTWFGNYLAYPISTIGKVFARINNIDYLCSGSVIQKNTIATAGSCMSDGAGHGATYMMFCPSYWKNAAGVAEPYPTRGCWPMVKYYLPGAWALNSNQDYNYGCFVTAQQGTVLNSPVGTIAGWTGVAWNLPTRQPTFAFGYPSVYPFPGYHIIATTSTEWYQVDMDNGGGQNSKYIGSDVTTGAEGGPWWLGICHRIGSNEYPATDSSDYTDPYQAWGYPYLNGVYGHRRYAGDIYGFYTQEMGSAQFLFTGGAADAPAIFNSCYNNGGY